MMLSCICCGNLTQDGDWLVHCLLDYLTGRTEYVRQDRVLSDVVVSGIGVTQGTVLSPLLFTL